ncbi:hypothetical protein [Streptosporangium sp. NPDC002721]|uniref:hypothetical protein n=1 Tax=Streptosporangium sp. NPDC002721 TaxID=3366188 RepID=UPI003682217D
MRTSTCSTCARPATLIITGRRPRLTLYTALTCDRCAAKHRARAAKAGPVTEETYGETVQDGLF